jgi:hypothetical protein
MGKHAAGRAGPTLSVSGTHETQAENAPVEVGAQLKKKPIHFIAKWRTIYHAAAGL